MHIVVESLSKNSETEWILGFRVDGKWLESRIILEHDGPLRYFNFEDRLTSNVLGHCGIDGDIAKRFFQFIDSGEPVLPWDFGDRECMYPDRIRKMLGAG